MTDETERPGTWDEAVRRDETYWDEVTRAVGTGTPGILLGTSARSLKKNLDRLRQAAAERAAAMDDGERMTAPEYPLLFVLKPGDDLTIRWMGELRMVHCDRITPEGAVFRDLTPAEAGGGVPARDENGKEG